jgi:hypothetical protein
MARRTLVAASKLAERFWSKVNKDGPPPSHRPGLGPCWLWTGSRTSDGYGKMGIGSLRDGTRRNERAHRVAHDMVIGPVPEGLFALHHCDTPLCVRAEVDPARSHVFSGTNDDNVADMVSKGRQSQGERRWSAKLTAVDAMTIRLRYGRGGIRMIDLAEEFGVSLSQISSIVRGAKWKGGPDEQQ